MEALWNIETNNIKQAFRYILSIPILELKGILRGKTQKTSRWHSPLEKDLFCLVQWWYFTIIRKTAWHTTIWYYNGTDLSYTWLSFSNKLLKPKYLICITLLNCLNYFIAKLVKVCISEFQHPMPPWKQTDHILQVKNLDMRPVGLWIYGDG